MIVHRFAGSVIAFADAVSEWLALGATAPTRPASNRRSRSAAAGCPAPHVSAAASLEGGTRWRDRVRLAPYTRTAIQIGIAVGAAIALGELLSAALLLGGDRRLHHLHGCQQLRRTGPQGAPPGGRDGRRHRRRLAARERRRHHTYWSIALILVSLFFGLYALRISYAFMAIAVTVMVSQLYVQLGEFSNSLLLLRLEETALGAAIAIVVATLVLPLRTRYVVRIALREYLQTLGTLLDHATSRLAGTSGRTSTLRADARALDAAYQTLLATAQPVRRTVFGTANKGVGQVVRLASASRNYSRNLVADAETSSPGVPETSRDITHATATLQQSLETIAEALNGPRDGTYTRSAALFDRAERRSRALHAQSASTQFALRDLKLIDGTMAQMAELIGLRVTDYDTENELTHGPRADRRTSVVRGPCHAAPGR